MQSMHWEQNKMLHVFSRRVVTIPSLQISTASFNTSVTWREQKAGGKLELQSSPQLVYRATTLNKTTVCSAFVHDLN